MAVLCTTPATNMKKNHKSKRPKRARPFLLSYYPQKHHLENELGGLKLFLYWENEQSQSCDECRLLHTYNYFLMAEDLLISITDCESEQ